MKSVNVTDMILDREINGKRSSGMAAMSMTVIAEEKAATCETDEIMNCQLQENTRSTFLVTFSPNGTKMASAHGNHKIYVTDVRTGKCLHTLTGHPRTPWCITFHPSFNDILASGCLGGQVRVWDLHGGCEVWIGERSSAIASIAFHPSDQVLVIATANIIYFWDWSKSQPFASCKTASEKERVRFVRFDLYGHRLFTGIANVPICRNRQGPGHPGTSSERDSTAGNNLPERLFVLNEQHRQLLSRLHDLHLQITTPWLPVFSRRRGGRSETESEQAEASVTLGIHVEPEHSQHDFSESIPRLSLQELQENLLSMRTRYTRICERLRELLMLRSQNSEASINNSAADARLVNSLFTFWREYESLAVSLQSAELNSDTRHHIAIAMISLIQLQDMLQTSILNHATAGSERGVARIIQSILMTILELVTSDTNILALRTTALEAIGRSVQPQWTSSVQRPEARRQRSTSQLSSSNPLPPSSSPRFSISSSLGSVPDSPSTSWTRYPLDSFRQMQSSSSTNNTSHTNDASESAFSQPRWTRNILQIPSENSRFHATEGVGLGMPSTSAAPSTSGNRHLVSRGAQYLNLLGDPSIRPEGTSRPEDTESAPEGEPLPIPTFMEGENATQSAEDERSWWQREASAALATTEQLLRSVLDELLNLLGSIGSNPSLNRDGTNSSNSQNSHSNSNSNSNRASPSFPASWYPYWWTHPWNSRSASTLYSETVSAAIRPTYRIQWWDFTRFLIPDISDSKVNIVVPECLIQNDANIEISLDGRLLATLVPCSIPTSTLLAVHSLQPDTFGQCLYLWHFSSSVISISLSLHGKYVLVGLGSNRRSLTNPGGKQVIGQVLQLIEGKDAEKEFLQHVRTVELRGENRMDVSVNSMRWLPGPGEGYVYGTNRGDLRICRPMSTVDVVKQMKHPLRQPPNAPRRSYRDIVARVLARRLNVSQSAYTRLVFPSTNSTGTQTESDSDSA